jgi:hypothetical protein
LLMQTSSNGQTRTCPQRSKLEILEALFVADSPSSD